MQPACLLRYAAIPGYRRRNKQVVEICKVEPLAQKAFGGNDDSALVLKAGKLAQYRLPLFSIDFPGEEDGLVSAVAKEPAKLLGMLFPF